MPTINVLSKQAHNSLAKNAGRPQAAAEVVFPMFSCISLEPSEVRGKGFVDVIVDDYPKE